MISDHDKKSWNIMKNKTIAKLSAVALSIGLLYILLSRVQFDEIVTTLTSINPAYIIAGFALYICSYFLRAFRFYILLHREIELKGLFNIICVHNMVNNILPARTGELSYIYLLKKVHKKTTGEGVASLMVARIFDIIALSLLFLISVLIVKDLPEIFMNTIGTVALFMVIMLIYLIVLLYSGRSFFGITKRFFGKYNLDQRKPGNYLLKIGEETVDSLEKTNIGNGIYLLILSSILIWLLNYSMVFFLLQGMTIHIPLQNVILGATFCLLTTVLPIQGVGGFGTSETVWTLVFVPLGMSLEAAIISGFSYHIILIMYYLFIGSYGLIALKATVRTTQ
ncbi:hypothetical protein MSSIH_2853 [Methanosarcina siciliae HI350]|uniref:Dolichol-P-glucose synthetase n=2 Tax=Methanosarcina siciliae TaxID=38027 RepID=A0A0E3PFL8_9EURY|nr:hypothetical protein MSSIH_2853 [Methanosarcina siciliae HI350]